MPEIITGTQPARPMSKLDFLRRLTFAERVAIEAAADTDHEVRAAKQAFMVAESIKTDDPETVMGVDLYISKGLIDPARKADILSA
jgi:hypothetical protein